MRLWCRDLVIKVLKVEGRGERFGLERLEGRGGKACFVRGGSRGAGRELVWIVVVLGLWRYLRMIEGLEVEG